MKIYVTTAWEAREHAKRIADAWEQRGHTITYKWWDEEVSGDWGDESYISTCAQKDQDAVERSDVFVLLAHPQAYGAMVELGMAIRGGARVIIAHDITHRGIMRDCVFYHLPNIRMVAGEKELLKEYES